MSDRLPNIAFAGLTAAGKTTHSKILAGQLGYKYVSATEIILDILNIGDDPNKVWLTDYEKIEKAREGDGVDIELESRVKQMANSRGGLVLDTWAMAYIYEGPLVRIWIDSDEDSRTRKCFVSQGEQKSLDISDCRALVNKKDGDTQTKFLDRLNFSLFTDMSRYDAVVCNTDLIPEATDNASTEGIRIFTPVIYDVATYLIDQALGENHPARLEALTQQHDSMILKVNRKPWSF